MHRVKLGRPSPAFALAAIALFVSLGGTGYAASRIVEGQATASKAKPLTKAQVNKQIAAYFKAHEGELQGAKGAVGTSGTNGDKGERGQIGPQGPGAIKIAAVGTSAVSGAEELATVGPWALTITCSTNAPNTTVTIKGPGELTQSVTTGGSPVLSGASIGSGATLKINTGTRLAETGFLTSGSTTYELNIQMTAENGGLFESCPAVGDAIPVPAS